MVEGIYLDFRVQLLIPLLSKLCYIRPLVAHDQLDMAIFSALMKKAYFCFLILGWMFSNGLKLWTPFYWLYGSCSMHISSREISWKLTNLFFSLSCTFSNCLSFIKLKLWRQPSERTSWEDYLWVAIVYILRLACSLSNYVNSGTVC